MTDTVSRQTTDNDTRPEGWIWTTLEQLAVTLKSGGTPSTKRPDFYDGDIPYAKVEDIVNAGKYLRSTKIKVTQAGIDNSSAWIVPKDSLLYTMYASYGVPTISAIDVATNQAIIALIPPATLLSQDYLYHYLWSIKASLGSRIQGTTQANLNAGIVKSIDVPLPPLNEQHRIVEKIEELFTKLDAGVRSLKQAQALLKSYRRSVLKAAVEGELSREWREAHRDGLEPASELLERILQERRVNWEANEISKMEAKGKIPKSNSWKSKYRIPDPPHEAELPSLPVGWTGARLQQLADHIVDGTHRTPKYKDAGVPFISAKDINNFHVHFGDCKFISEQEHEELIKRCFPTKGSVLVTKSGTIGRTAVVETDTPFSLFESVALVPILPPTVPEYISYIVHWESIGEFGTKHRKGIAVRASVNRECVVV